MSSNEIMKSLSISTPIGMAPKDFTAVKVETHDNPGTKTWSFFFIPIDFKAK